MSYNLDRLCIVVAVGDSFVDCDAEVDSIMNLTKKFAGRVIVNGSEGGYIQLTLGKNEKPLQMKAVVETMQGE